MTCVIVRMFGWKFDDEIRVLLANLSQSVSQKREYIIGKLYIKETNTWLKRRVITIS